jgi:hypothetical protein
MRQWNLTEAANEAALSIKAMGREKIDKAHAVGLPGVYMRDGEIVREYPDGRIEEVRR